MASAANKDIIREIKNSRNRFFSIIILVALAVAFLSGLRATAPDMKRTGDKYLDQQRLLDIQVISNLGITHEDVEVLSRQPHIAYAEGAYVIDAWADDIVAKVYSITSNVNLLTLMEGRMPRVMGECVADHNLLESAGLSIGDTVGITPGEDYEDSIKRKSFKIVGMVRSPYYISVERGAASIGSGSVKAYVYLPPDAFDMEEYTAAYLLTEEGMGLTAFYDEYDDYVDDIIDSMEPLGEERARLRHDEIVDEARDKISDAQKELDDAEKEVAEELADGEKELKDARRKLDKGWRDYRKGKKELEEAYPDLIEGEQELRDAREELRKGRQKYDDGKKELDANKPQIDAAREGIAQYDKAAAAVPQLEVGIAQCKAGIEQCASGIGECDARLKELGDPPADENREEYEKIMAHKQELESRKSGLEAQMVQLTSNLEAVKAVLTPENAAKINAAREQVGKYDAARQQLDAAKAELDEGRAEWEKGRRELDEGWDDYIEGVEKLPKAYRDLKDGEKEYEEGVKEYEEGKIEAEEEIADAREELADARRKLADVEEGEWYILSRAYNPGYTGFGQDADRMANLSIVFPMIFFLVAALVCLTTMTRMVEDQRTQIGLMKALGYSRWTISKKYISYGLLPSLAGSILGLILGHILFPVMIYVSYQIMYEMPNISLSFYPGTSFWASAAAVACTTLSTLWACLSTLTDVAANLMRPRAPKPGKRVLLERIPWLWQRLNFNWKITIRNLLRYQKRFWMTVIGIGGCTALIIAGFGLRDSLMVTMDRQYGEILNYDIQVTFSEGLLDTEKEEITEYISHAEKVEDHVDMYAANVTAQTDAYSINSYLEVMEADEIGKAVNIKNYKTGDIMPLPEKGVMIDQKLSELLKVGVGDTFTLDNGEMREATVAGIYENYVAHFIYMTPSAYADIFGSPEDANSVLLNIGDKSRENCENTMKDMLELNGVAGATRTQDIRNTYHKSMERVDFVVMVVILCAAALAIVVLYNLANINMTERMRELATIKVLGFYDREVTLYVFRENMVLTIIGIALGCVFGKYLHGWLIRSVEIDLMMFGRETSPASYLLASGLTVIFSMAVNFMGHLKMKKIDMVESLKSPE